MESQFCPTCGTNVKARAYRTRYTITPLGKAVLAVMRMRADGLGTLPRAGKSEVQEKAEREGSGRRAHGS